MGIIVSGHKQHGKDTFCEFSGLTWRSSSEFANEVAVFPFLRNIYGYKTPQECHEDRVNHRKEWFELISGYNTPDLTRLGRALFATSEVYCGIRNIYELEALQNAGLVDLVIWIDASSRQEEESTDSITVTRECADLVVSNNTTLEDLKYRVNSIIRGLRPLLLSA